MIRYLAIRNLAVIESVSVEFDASFNVLTGETGAGKSMLVGAVGLLLGGRASADLVRTGEETATVEAAFEGPSGDETIVRREISSQGRSRAFVNGQLATASALRDLAATLVELHGQHEHQALLAPDTHLPLLDAWAGLDQKAAAVSAAWTQVRQLRDHADRAALDVRERAARLELVEFQLRDLRSASLTPGEDERLRSTRDVLRHADTLRRLSGEAYAALYDSESAALVQLGGVWKRVAELAAIDPTFQPYLDARDAMKAQLEDLALALRDYGERIDASPQRLQEAEDRLALVERLMRKHGPTLDDVLARQVALEAEAAALGGHEASPEALAARLRDATRHYETLATALSDERQSAARRFAAALQRELAELALPHARIEMRFTRLDAAAWTDRGVDHAEFYLSPNPGEDLRPLARIASGGELSRIMLGLKTLASAGRGSHRTLVFDEVDAGIGGRAATVVGDRLRRLGDGHQVLCITHLPQIAAAAGTHFAIDKTVRGQRTTTSVRRLSTPERVDELARMMSGGHAPDAARDAARAMLEQTQRPATAANGSEAKGESRSEAKAKPRGRGDATGH